MDPRVRERRNEVARNQGRRRLRRLVLVLVVVVLLAGAGLAARSSLLDVDRVQVRGAQHTDVAEIREAAGIPLGRSMISVDPAAARRRLLRLPWVEQATVERQWPATVVVDVVERRPVAVAGTGPSAVLVDRAGHALGPDDGAGLPQVSGAAVSPGGRLGPQRAELVAAVAALPVELRHQVDRAWTADGQIRLVLDDGIVVLWGDGSRSLAKANAVLALLEQADRPSIARVDVSVPTAAAITRKAGGEG